MANGNNQYLFVAAPLATPSPRKNTTVSKQGRHLQNTMVDSLAFSYWTVLSNARLDGGLAIFSSISFKGQINTDCTNDHYRCDQHHGGGILNAL